jgi:hypothetical protein
MKRGTIILIKVKSCNDMYEYVSKISFDIYILNFGNLSSGHYLREQGYEEPWLFFESKRILRAKILGNTGLVYFVSS